MPKKVLKLRELLKKLKPYGVIILPGRGKGSESILLKPDPQNSKKGPQYPIKNHGPGTEISKPVVDRVLDRFEINEEDFWK